jgi:hypothetical protein
MFDPHNFDENNPAIRKSGYLALKGVVALTNTRYRVQLNAFKHEKKKFSRNTSDLNEVSEMIRFSFSLLFKSICFFLSKGVVDLRSVFTSL